MRTSTRIVWDRKGIAALKTDPEIVAYVDEVARGLAGVMRAEAPKLTGAGAGSIQARPSRTKGARDVGWDKAHFYLSFQNNFANLGSKANSNFRFALTALNRYTHD